MLFDGKAESDRAVKLAAGASSPLWSGFLFAAAAGAAYWGWTRWLKPTEAPLSPQAAPADITPPTAVEKTPPAAVERVKAEEPTLPATAATVAPVVPEAVVETVAPPPVSKPRAAAAKKASAATLATPKPAKTVPASAAPPKVAGKARKPAATAAKAAPKRKSPTAPPA